jgi:hypothetical protein
MGMIGASTGMRPHRRACLASQRLPGKGIP